MPSIIIFPGQGAQYVGMIKNIISIPKVQQMFEIASDVFKKDLLSLCLNGPKSELDKTINCQPAVFVASMAAVEMLKNTNPKAIEECYATAGFSIGEYSSLVLSGAMTYEDALKVIKVRAESMQQATELNPSGLMTAFVGRQSKLPLALLASRKWCKEKLKLEEPIACSIANYLSAQVKVIGGNDEALEFIQMNYKEFGIQKLKRLPVSGAFHTKLMQSAEKPLREILKETVIKKPLIKYHSNFDAKTHTNPDKIRFLLVKQISNPVRWEQTLNELYYDKNLPTVSNQKSETELEGTLDLIEANEENSEKKKQTKISQSADRIYPDIYECGPSSHTGSILRTLNHKAYGFYKLVQV